MCGLFLVFLCQYTVSSFPSCMQRMKHFADVFTSGLHPKFGWYSGWDLLRRVYFVLVALWLPYLYISTRLVCAHSTSTSQHMGGIKVYPWLHGTGGLLTLPFHSLPFLPHPYSCTVSSSYHLHRLSTPYPSSLPILSPSSHSFPSMPSSHPPSLPPILPPSLPPILPPSLLPLPPLSLPCCSLRL